MNNQTNLFYNTTGETGQELEEAKMKADSQNERVYFIFKDANTALTPFEASKIYDKRFSPAPLTSIRRAIHTLTSESLLIKNECITRVGGYGRPNYTWELNK